MKKLFAIISLFALVLTSCEKEETIVIGSNFDTITATIESASDTKATLEKIDDQVSVKWADEDAISVFYKTGTDIVNVKYNLTNGAGSTTGTFTKDQTEAEDLSSASMIAAVYPYTENAKYNATNSEITGMTAAVDKYPMAYKGEGPQISFKNAGALVQVITSSIPDGVNTLILSSETKGLAGDYTINFDNEGTPNAIGTTNSIKNIEYSSPESLANRTIYFPIYIDSYADLTVTAKDNSTSYTVVAPKALSTKRNTVHYTSAGVMSVSNDTELLNAVNSESTNITVIVGSSITSIKLPGSTGKTITLLIENTTDNISIATQTGNQVSSKINLIFKERTSGDLEVNLPDATVEVSGNATFDNIISTTAENTLILGSGITATNVTVKKGNIQVNKDANLNGINTDNVTSVIVIDNGGNINQEVSNNEKVTKIDYEYYPEYLLKQAVENDESYTLTEDIEISETLVIPAGKTFTLNLNGKTISQTKACTASYSMIENKGTLTINGNGKISFTDDGNGDSSFGWGSYTISNNNGTLTIDGATIEHLGNQEFATHMICAIFQYSGSTIIKDGTISTPAYRSARLWKGNMTINGGTFDGQLWVQSVDNSAELTINGGKFSPNGKDGSSVYVENTSYTVKFNVSDGYFETKIGCADATRDGAKGAVKGGIFTKTAIDGTNQSLIAEGYTFELNSDATYTLSPSFVKTAEDSYTIYSVSGLKAFRDVVNNGSNFHGFTIQLDKDLDLNNENWTPIGFNSNDEAGNEPYFSGTFDGNNHTISNLKIDVTDKGGVGLFGAVHNATFKNFTLNNVDVKAVESESDPTNSSGAEGKKNYIVGGHMGAVAGYDAAAGTLNFENVHVTGLIKIEGETRAAQGQRVGGIIGGRSSSKVNFNNVSVKGSEGSYIKGYCSTAGVMGQVQNVGKFEDVHTHIDVHAVTFGAGGIIGIARQGSTFTNCSSAGDITLDASKTQLSSYSANYPYRVGGIAGCWSESSTGVLTLATCTYTGVLTSIDKDGNKVTALDYAGYVGRGYTLKNCAGSKVVIDGISYVQADNTVYGVYTIDGVYEMNTLADMQWLANMVNTGADYFTGKTVKLANDIDLNNVEWTPIGSASLEHGFCGNFDGNGKTIKNLKMTQLTLDTDGYAYAGLFGVTEGTSKDEQKYIKDLIIENVNISTNGHIVAAAIAYPYYTTVENITVKGNVNIQGGDYTAGILAYTRRCVDAKNLVIDANSASAITGTQTVGGVISDIQMNGGLTANYSNFKASGLIITGDKCVGGISGIISTQTLDGATVENVSIKCNDARRGTVSGALGGKSTIKNISVTNVEGATNVVGATYNGANDVIVEGDVYDIPSENN